MLLLGASLAGAAEPATPAATYAAECSLCHGERGAGDGMAAAMLQPAPTNFSAPGYWKKADRAALRKVIRDGKAGTAMAPFATKLDAAQIDALLKLLESFGAAD